MNIFGDFRKRLWKFVDETRFFRNSVIYIAHLFSILV